jgi:MoaA/NifB/PqqE/SkfB family radical SAM enzyme
MTPKFWYRTARNLIVRNRPYFAHLAFTHKCNLRCRFCHIPEERIEQQDTEGMKTIIDRLDQMGIAILSISGGGEPLLRPDFAVLLNYAADKGLFTKITSNGTMPQSKYQELLATRISEIAISLDGVQGNDLPYSHTGPKILETIRFLSDNLPRGKVLTINVTISSSNRAQVGQIVTYCTQEFPRARIWLNPVVVGQGKLRVATQEKVNPDYMRRLDSATLLTPGFFKRACEEYYQNETYNWGCLAGKFFFDIKPNGDLWICQDHPPMDPLNILDPDFERKYRQADFSHRRDCAGCTYSCYYVTQKSFEPRAWPGMAGIWWKTVTQPGEGCRTTAERHGWLAGLLHFSAARFLLAAKAAARTTLWVGLLAAVLLPGSLARGQMVPETLDPQEIVTRMEQCNARRAEVLRSYTSQRRYYAANALLHREGYSVVEVKFQAPEGKEFRVIERGGSSSIQKRVFVPIIQTEDANSRSPAREATEISNRNYTFTFQGYDAVADAYIFQAEPRTKKKYLFRGKIWINAGEFAIQRIEGEPAQKHSFWIRRTKFVHEYGKFGGFWFPVSNRTVVELRLFGRSTMNIDYFAYAWEPRMAAGCVAPSPRIQPLPRPTVSRAGFAP